MKACGDVKTDETLHELAVHGSQAFPFQCYHGLLGNTPELDIPWHWHRELELVVIESGFTQCLIGGDTLPLHPGEGILLYPGVIHRFDTPGLVAISNLLYMPEFISSEPSGLYQKFVAPLLATNLSYTLFDSHTPWQVQVLSDVAAIGRATREENPSMELTVHAAVCLLWSRLYAHRAEICAHSRPEGSKLLQARLRRMLTFIETQYGNPVSLYDIARDANVSKSEVLRCFREGVHATPIGYLNLYRLDRARARLITTALPVTDIAIESGFSSAAYFDRMFRRNFHQSPTRYRKQHGI